MARVQRDMTPWRFVTRGVKGLPAVAACMTRFRNWRQLLGLYTGMAEFKPPFVITGRRGFALTSWEPADIQSCWGIFCAQTYRVPRGCGVVLDLGANIGGFSIYAARVRGARRVISLEPVAATFEKLRKNMADNGLDGTVTTIHKGIGGTAGPRTIHLGVSSPHSSMYYRADPRYESGRTEQIEVTTLEALFDEFQIDEVDMCKLDCEGGEVEALLAASDSVLRRIKRMSMEYHFPANISDEPTLFGRLKAAGFRCVWHDRESKMAELVRDGA